MLSFTPEILSALWDTLGDILHKPTLKTIPMTPKLRIIKNTKQSATGIDRLQDILTAYSCVDKEFVSKFNLDQLVCIYYAWYIVGWDRTPDTWTNQQISEAIAGLVPTWDKANEPIYYTKGVVKHAVNGQ